MIVPVVETSVADGTLRTPKYGDRVRVYSGAVISIESGTYAGEYYYVCFQAEQTTLDDILANDDAYAIDPNADAAADVRDALNRKTGHNRTVEEWIDAFAASDTTIA